MTSINFESVDYEKLTKLQRLAIFFIIIGSENAAVLMQNFSDDEVEAVCKQIATIRVIDEPLKTRVLQEFSGIVLRSTRSLLGGADFAQKTLSLTRGESDTLRLMGRIDAADSVAELIEKINTLEARQIYNLISQEKEQTIAFLISNLKLQKATELFMLMSPEQRNAVVYKMGEMEPVPKHVLARIVDALQKHEADFVGSLNATYAIGGVKQAAELMNKLPKDVSKEVLVHLEGKNQSLALSIRKKMFGFEDIIKVEVQDLQRVVRDIDMADLVLALKTAPSYIQDHFFKSVSKRAAATIKDEMSLLSKVKNKDVTDARDKIIAVVRDLQEKGEIAFGDEEGIEA
jgi:flagellar motor switch protein FliG